ncbi:MAG: hypothetical protein EXS10_08820 [Phycisphaerales bacterium]|nr:hypothetical protein [Phycisphaerales bacterium]
MSSFGTPQPLQSLAASFAAQQLSHGKVRIPSKESREALRRMVEQSEVRAADSVELTEAVPSKPDAAQEEKHRRKQQRDARKTPQSEHERDDDAPRSHLDVRA